MSEMENVVEGQTEKKNAQKEKEVLLEKSDEFRDECMDLFLKKAKGKYDKGQEEHGGLLPLDVKFNDLEDEVIDQWFYLQAIKAKIKNLAPESEVELNGKR